MCVPGTGNPPGPARNVTANFVRGSGVAGAAQKARNIASGAYRHGPLSDKQIRAAKSGDPEGKTPIGRFVLRMGPAGFAKKRLLGK